MSAPQNAPTLTRPLGLGCNGDEVRTLQAQLNQAGLGVVLVADGRFGRKTHVALQGFQRQKSLKPDGVVGAKTALALGWNYRGVDARPYTISFEKPPLPATTPPLSAVVETIRVGMAAFRELMFEGITKAYSRTNYGVPTPQDVHQKQFHQVRLRADDLDQHIAKLSRDLKQLQDQAATGRAPDLAGARSAFTWFVADMHSALRAMDLFSANTRACATALDRLPYPHVLDIVGRFLRGEATAPSAIVLVRLAFENANRDFRQQLQTG